MPEKYLYERLAEEFGKRTLGQIEIPARLKDNLNPLYELRPYQVDAFQRFICYFKNQFDFKQRPSHLLFNMATGSGKTLIMAGLILYLYEEGYRNFLFFVNSTNIIEKTKDNFLNPGSIKYLFNQTIVINNHRLHVSPVENFEGVNPSNINICFTTIQKLHSDLTTEKENAITFQDFRKHKVVLIADEAHHINVQTRAEMEMFESWENTVQRIFEQNQDNLLLEFTATHDYETPAMVDKYRNKVIIRYDLLQFRNDRFSKDVVIVQSDFGLPERILQALILSQYKQEVAAKARISLKPVILFKAQRTIAQSQENKAAFHGLVEGLTVKQVARIRKSDIPIVRHAFRYFRENQISDGQLVERLKHDFHRDYCLSVNEETEKEQYQILLNTLEDKNNHIRAIFAVQKLSEGWDVLNLFDIVRCYEARDTGGGTLGRTTVSEAQLIGRGARYFPFVLPDNNDRFRRKFDGDIEHEMRVLEVLHYHSINDSRYIAEIRAALVNEGMLDEHTVDRHLTLKDSFKKTQFYKHGLIYVNRQLKRDYDGIKSFADLGVKKRNYIHVIASGHGGEGTVLAGGPLVAVLTDETRKDIGVRDLERNIVQSAVARTPFFTFASIRRFFPNCGSMREFITSDCYLGGLEITFQGNAHGLDENKKEKLSAVIGLLNQIEVEIRQQTCEYQGSKDFAGSVVQSVFDDKTLTLDENCERGREDVGFAQFVSNKDWFAFNTIFGTSEEKGFVRMLDRQMSTLKEQYGSIYLVRNEGHFKIYNFSDGAAFEPDFVLFLREKSGAVLTYQMFIEPKGKHIQEHDRWKETFLKEITEEFRDKDRVLILEGKSKYRLIGVPFYNIEDENAFRASFWEAIG